MQAFDHSSDYPSTPNSIHVGAEQPMESQVIPHWSWTTCTKWQAEKRLMCLPEPAEVNAELSTQSPFPICICCWGDIRDVTCLHTGLLAVLIQNIILIQTMSFIPTKGYDESVCRSAFLNTYHNFLSFLVCSYYQICVAYI